MYILINKCVTYPAIITVGIFGNGNISIRIKASVVPTNMYKLLITYTHHGTRFILR